MFQSLKSAVQGITLTAALSGAAKAQQPASTPPAPTTVATAQQGQDSAAAISTNLEKARETIGKYIRHAELIRVTEGGGRRADHAETTENAITLAEALKLSLDNGKNLELAAVNFQVEALKIADGLKAFQRIMPRVTDSERKEGWEAMSKVIAPAVVEMALVNEYIKKNLETFLERDKKSLTQQEIDNRQQMLKTITGTMDKAFQELTNAVKNSGTDKQYVHALAGQILVGSDLEIVRARLLRALAINPTTGTSAEAEFLARTIANNEAQAKEQAAKNAANQALNGSQIAKPADDKHNSCLQAIQKVALWAAPTAVIFGALCRL